jgi:hypothetical protein
MPVAAGRKNRDQWQSLITFAHAEQGQSPRSSYSALPKLVPRRRYIRMEQFRSVPR